MNKIVSKIKLLLVVGVFSHLSPLISHLLIPCLLVLVSCLYVSCDEQGIPNIDDLMTSENTEETAGEGLQIIDYEYSDDYKGMELSAQLMSDIGGYDLTDSLTVAVRPLQEFQILPGQYGDETQPLIKSVRNVSREALQKMNNKLLVLVDLSLPQQEIDAECGQLISAFHIS